MHALALRARVAAPLASAGASDRALRVLTSRHAHARDGALRSRVVAASSPTRRRSSAAAHPPRAMAPFRNPFARKPAPPGPKPPSGAEVLAEAIQKGAEKARAKGVQSVLADVRDGVAQRNYGNGGSWPEAAEARRRQRCPRCDADTSEARARAEADGVEVDPMGDPVEQARAGRHPLGWCEACAENNRLIDVSGGF